MGKILYINLGGTIASQNTGSTAGNARITLSSSQILAVAAPYLGDWRIEHADLLGTPSANLTLSDIGVVQRFIEDRIRTQPSTTAVVVTMGTDMMEEFAFGLSIGWRQQPIFVTGSMSHADLPGADGPGNLRDAFIAARAGQDLGGVFVVIDGRIHRADRVYKTASFTKGAFESFPLGPVGYVAEGRAYFETGSAAAREAAIAIPDEFSPGKILLLKMSLGDEGEILRSLDQLDIDGVVIEGAGGGHVSDQFASRLFDSALPSRVPVVLSSRFGSGIGLTNTYGWESGSERSLLGGGLISSGWLSGVKARVLLAFLTKLELDINQIRDFFWCRYVATAPRKPDSPSDTPRE